MARRKINTNTGDSTHFGAVDGVTQINELLTGVDQSSADPVDINTTWTFDGSNKCQIASPSDVSKVYTIATSALTGNRNLTIPAITANDTFVTLAHQQTITGKTINVPSGASSSIASVVGPDLMLYPSSNVRTGGWVGGLNTTGFGFWNGVLTAAASAGTITYPLSATDGKYTNLPTSTSAGGNAGMRGSDGTGIIGSLDPKFYCKFRINSNTGSDCRVWIGLWSVNNAFPSNADDVLASRSGFLFGHNAASSNWQILHNEGTGATVADDITPTTAKNQNINTIQFQYNSSTPSWQYSLNGASYQSVTSEIPAAGTILYPLILIQNVTAGAARNFDCWHAFLQITEPAFG